MTVVVEAKETSCLGLLLSLLIGPNSRPSPMNSSQNTSFKVLMLPVTSLDFAPNQLLTKLVVP